MFVPIHTPFASSSEHGFALVAALREEYGQSRDGLAELGIDGGWEPPPASRQERDVAYLIRACETLRAHYGMPGSSCSSCGPTG